jgi:hypothetical protein
VSRVGCHDGPIMAIRAAERNGVWRSL